MTAPRVAGRQMRILLAATLALGLAACESSKERPVTVGRGRDDLKSSPCACIAVELVPVTPDWLRDIADPLGQAGSAG